MRTYYNITCVVLATLACLLLAVPLPGQAQVSQVSYGTIDLPLGYSGVRWMGISPEGLLWVAAIKSPLDRNGFLHSREPGPGKDFKPYSGPMFINNSSLRGVTQENQVVTSFFVALDTSLLMGATQRGSINSGPYRLNRIVQQASLGNPNLAKLCSDQQIIFFDNRPYKPNTLNGPAPGPDGKMYFFASGADFFLNTWKSGIFTFAETRNNGDTCNLNLVSGMEMGREEILQVWKESSGSFLAEKLVSIIPGAATSLVPMLMPASTEVVRVQSSGFVEMLVSANPQASPKVRAAECCTLAAEPATGKGLVGLKGSDNKPRAAYVNGNQLTEVFVGSGSTVAAGNVLARGLAGKWGLLVGSKYGDKWDGLGLVNVETKEYATIASPGATTAGKLITSIAPESAVVDGGGTVYYGFPDSPKIYYATVTPPQLPTPQVNPLGDALPGTKVTVQGKDIVFAASSGITSTVLVNGQPAPTAVESSALTFTAPAAPGTYRVQVRLAGLGQTKDSNEVTLAVVMATPLPAITSVTHGGNFQENFLAPGLHFSVFGQNFGSGGDASSYAMVRTVLGETSVELDGVKLRLYYVVPKQINAALPQSLAPGEYNLVVKVGSAASLAKRITVASQAIAAFQFDPGTGQPIPIMTDERYALLGNPGLNLPFLVAARQKGALIFWATGGGRTTTAISDGTYSPAGSYLLETVPSVTLAPAEWPGEPLQLIPAYAGRAPGFASLDQIAVILPDNLIPLEKQDGQPHKFTITLGGTPYSVWIY